MTERIYKKASPRIKCPQCGGRKFRIMPGLTLVVEEERSRSKYVKRRARVVYAFFWSDDQNEFAFLTCHNEKCRYQFDPEDSPFVDVIIQKPLVFSGGSEVRFAFREKDKWHF